MKQSLLLYLSRVARFSAACFVFVCGFSKLSATAILDADYVVTVVPEPGFYAFLLGGLCLLIGLRRKNRRRIR